MRSSRFWSVVPPALTSTARRIGSGMTNYQVPSTKNQVPSSVLGTWYLVPGTLPMFAYLLAPAGFDGADAGALAAALAALLALVWFFPHAACAVPLWVVTHTFWSLRRYGFE